MKKKHHLHLLVIALLFCLVFSACSIAPPAHTESPSESNFQMTSFEIESNLKNAHEYNYSDFDIGSGIYTTQGNHEMPYKVRGIIALPEGEGPFPLVLIAHGAHEEEDESKRFDTGFDYLVKGLAQNGYIAVSMDVLMPYIQRYGGNDDYIEKMTAIVNDHIQGLYSAHDGASLYPMDLTGKINFQQTALLGHSRSGAAVFQLAKEGVEQGLGVKAILSLAPSADLRVEFTGLPTAFLVPQYDGDVIQLDGVYMYDYLENRVAGDHSITLLMGANHNFFNRSLERDDSIARGMESSYTPLSRKEQEDFLLNFSVDFFNSTLEGEDSFYMFSQAQPNKMYGRDINRQVRLLEPVNLINAFETNGFSSDTAAISHVVDSVLFNQDEVLINTVTISVLKSVLEGNDDTNSDVLEYVPLNRDLICIEWTKKDTRVSMTPLVTDFSGKSAMSINMIPDSASELNTPGQALSLTVILKDTRGNVAAVTTAPNQNVLSPYPGELGKTVLTEDFSIEYWEPTSPMGMLHIPLSCFEAVDISTISSVELLFDNSESGSIFISSWQLQ